MTNREFLRQLGVPDYIEERIKRANQLAIELSQPRETSLALTTDMEPIADITFQEAMQFYPDFLRTKLVPEESIESVVNRISQDFYNGDPVQRAKILDGLSHSRRSTSMIETEFVAGTIPHSEQRTQGLIQNQVLTMGEPAQITGD